MWIDQKCLDFNKKFAQIAKKHTNIFFKFILHFKRLLVAYTLHFFMFSIAYFVDFSVVAATRDE